MPAIIKEVRCDYSDIEESAMGDCEIMCALRRGVAAYKIAGRDALTAMRRAILVKIDRLLWGACEWEARLNRNECGRTWTSMRLISRRSIWSLY
jgi:hypothetical protein